VGKGEETKRGGKAAVRRNTFEKCRAGERKKGRLLCDYGRGEDGTRGTDQARAGRQVTNEGGTGGVSGDREGEGKGRRGERGVKNDWKWGGGGEGEGECSGRGTGAGGGRRRKRSHSLTCGTLRIYNHIGAQRTCTSRGSSGGVANPSSEIRARGGGGGARK